MTVSVKTSSNLPKTEVSCDLALLRSWLLAMSMEAEESAMLEATTKQQLVKTEQTEKT